MRKGNTANARECALSVLVACRRNGAWADAALKAQLGKCALSAQDAALCSRIVYGVMQNELLLNWYLSAYCTQKLDHLQPPLADILRIGAYQILFLDKVPDHAAVSESVELCRTNGRSAASGLVNAVLRKVAQNKSNLPPLPEGNIARLSVAYSHPQWLVKKLVSLLGVEEAEAFLRIDNEASPISVQVNPLKTNEKALVDELRGEGVCVTPHPWVPGCLELSGTGDLTTLSAFYNGRFTVQDAAAHLIVCAADFARGQRVLDVCAAPGGKSFAAAFAMENEGSILSCDLHENKLKRIREGAQRLGITCIETAAVDGRAFREEWAGRAILENSARYVKRGGLLVYSTCTILPEENEQVTDGFLKAHDEFTYEAFSLPNGVSVPGHLTLWPQRDNTDGFYLSRMRRKTHD